MAKIRSTIYIEQEAWKTFLLISRREGESASEKIEEFIEEYNKLHGPGNPQLTLINLDYRAPKKWKKCVKGPEQLDKLGEFVCNGQIKIPKACETCRGFYPKEVLKK